MSHIWQQYKLRFRPKKPIFLSLTGFYFVSFFFEHPVTYLSFIWSSFLPELLSPVHISEHIRRHSCDPSNCKIVMVLTISKFYTFPIFRKMLKIWSWVTSASSTTSTDRPHPKLADSPTNTSFAMAVNIVTNAVENLPWLTSLHTFIHGKVNVIRACPASSNIVKSNIEAAIFILTWLTRCRSTVFKTSQARIWWCQVWAVNTSILKALITAFVDIIQGVGRTTVFRA